jgi:HK97 family phage portal protein
MAVLRDFIDKYVWPLEKRYPITGDAAGWHQYLNDIATSAYPKGTPIWGSDDYAIRIATVFICVLVRGESLKSLPASVKQVTAEGSKVAYNHPVHYLIHDRPNPFQTAGDFWESVSARIDLEGNCFAIITYSGRFQPTRIDLTDQGAEVEVLKTASGQAYYRYNGRDYKDYEVLHFKDMSLDGYYGVSKIKYNCETMGYARKLKDYGSNAIGTKPPGYFTTQSPFSTIKTQEESLTKGWSENIAAGRTPFLPLGLEYKNLQINPGDAQYLEAIGATKEDIYGIFRVPPTLAQNYLRATFANAEQQDLVFIKYTMLPMVLNIEQECNAKLFSEANKTSATPYYVKFNVNAFMRGDFTSRTQGYRTLWERGLITGNMVADLEDWDHFEGGERRFIPMNMMPLDKVDEFLDKLNEPKQTNVADSGGNNQDRSMKVKMEDLITSLKKHNLNGYEH